MKTELSHAASPRLLETDTLNLPMARRLLCAVTRMEREEQGIELRPHQQGVYQSAALYLKEIATRSQGEGDFPFARIVLPPRIGKTVIAARIIECSKLVTVYITTTLDLVHQAHREFLTKLPGVPIAVLTGEVKDPLSDHGIVVMTYGMLQALVRKGSVPEAMRRAGLVFVDEAHHAMTELRSGVLREAFDPLAIRMALTATPDYDEERVLAKFFPDLIHEMTIAESVASDLLAKVSTFSVAIDVGAADVRVVAGNYEADDLGLVMSRLPLLRAALIVRYDDRFRHIPTLITCASSAQAKCVQEHLRDHRPEGAPVPALLSGGMDKTLRRTTLEAFEAGAIDTLIVVKLLVEGWNSPKCKCLIDLAPSTSWVWSAQKYTRVMTKDGDAEARIITLQPLYLPRTPVLPVDVFGPGATESLEVAPAKADAPRVSRTRGSSAWARLREAGIRVLSVRAEVKLSEDCRIDQIRLPPNPQRLFRRLFRAVSLYPLALDYVSYSRFLAARFMINGVGVKGSQLLRFLRFDVTLVGYQTFVASYFPDDVSEKILHGENAAFYASRFRERVPAPDSYSREPIATISIVEMEERFSQRLKREKDRASDGQSVWDVYGGIEPGRYSLSSGPLSAEDAFIEKYISAERASLLETLSPWEERILRWRFGLDGEEELSLREIGEKYNLGRERIRQIQVEALAKLRLRLSGRLRDIICDT